MNDGSSEPLSAIRAIEGVTPKKIPFELFDKKNRKTTKLADLAAPAPMKGRHDWYEFEFIEPVFVSTILVEVADYDFKSCSFQWQSISTGEKRSEETGHESNSFGVKVNDFITKFSFRPGRKYLGDPQIVSVSATGFKLEEYIEERDKIGRIAELRMDAIRDAQNKISKASEAEARLEEIEEEIEERERDHDSLRSISENLGSEIKIWKEKIEISERELARNRTS